ncbi:5-formyltetrahydrofolate cyclo-ligase, partial [bacterium]|nr:5-formyltetrahydrofolate cyclo-ligase [bacterium]MBU1991214.1 5-formyltetrahydrofolate cyclo-ligase [bacterium]
FKMVPFRLPLKEKRFGIFEAGNTIRNIKKIDIAIVPAVGVDGNLQRIGFGKGMYDRFFENLKKKPYTIFIQLEFCYTKKYICDSYDVSCDLLLTPKTKIVPTGRVKRGK